MQHLGGMTQTILAVLKDMPGYEEAVLKMKEKEEKAEVEASKEHIIDEDGKGAIDYTAEDEARMDVIGQNGNTGEHYE